MPPRPSSEMISNGPSVRPSRLMSVIDVTSLRAIRQRRSGNDSAGQKVPGFPNLNVALFILSHRWALVNHTHERNRSKWYFLLHLLFVFRSTSEKRTTKRRYSTAVKDHIWALGKS